MISSNQTPAGRSIRLYTVMGMGTLALMVLCVGGWAATTDLSGAVIGTGTVVVDGNVKRIQHREGGIVGEIRVRNGTFVAAGDLLIGLDDTVTRASLSIITKQIEH
ncbi:RspE-like type I secretion system membrane fusion protein (MFP) [Agrobacterium tumefaciens str. Cherry 2E-2-2]|nr:RspE-like type I secretion system membrane fusion protein (MFP) [Agrobacterium tumefaciens str. Cherry 2E-2-2]